MLGTAGAAAAGAAAAGAAAVSKAEWPSEGVGKGAGSGSFGPGKLPFLKRNGPRRESERAPDRALLAPGIGRF